MEAKVIKSEKMLMAMDSMYSQLINGLPGQLNIYQLADDYRSKYKNNEEAIDKIIKWHTTQATVTGAVTGLGGVLTLPISLPADLVGCLAIQLRMIGAIAVLRGYDLSDDKVRTLAFVCLVGSSANDLLKETGLKVGLKMTEKLIEKIPGKILIKINQKVGFRLVTKGGSKGMINLTKMIPLVGSPISGGFNFVETKAVAKAAKDTFV